MTHNYKKGDKVLAEVKITELNSSGINIGSLHDVFWVSLEKVRPYTPRQEFEYGEEVEVSDSGNQWVKAKYIGKSHEYNVNPYDTYVVNPISSNGHLCGTLRFRYCRKISEVKPRETITIAGVTYDKAEFEAAVKDLKPIGDEK